MDIEKKHATIKNYQLLKLLGQGYNAKVKLGYNIDDEKYYAIKIFKKTHSFEKNRDSLTKEFQVMQHLNHPNLVNLKEIIPEAEYIKKNGQSYPTMAIVLEYAKAGELFEFVAQQRFTETESRTYFTQMLTGLEYLHSQGIAHRDMKPENVLFDENFQLKIADFGFATALVGKDGSGLLKTILGTESYMAPEIHQHDKYSGTAVDIFACGIILFIMYAGHPPFMKADSKSDAYYKCLCNNRHATFWKAHSKNKPNKDDFFTQELQNLFNSLFAQDPNQRPTLGEIKSHPWMQGPVLDGQQLFSAFNNRFKAVEAALEQQRQAKLLEKQKKEQQSNLMFTGVGKFRGENEIIEEFAGLEQLFPTLNNQRAMKKYNVNAQRPNDVFSVIDTSYLLKCLLQRHSEYATQINVDDSNYKIKCVKTDENGENTEFNIEFQEKDDNEVCISFKKTFGSSVEFYTLVEKAKCIIEGKKKEALPEVQQQVQE